MYTIFKFCLTCKYSILTKHYRFLFGFYRGSNILDWSFRCNKRVYRKINNFYDSDDRNRGERKANLWHHTKAIRKSHRLGNFAPSCQITIRILSSKFKSFTKKQEWYSIERNVIRKYYFSTVYFFSMVLKLSYFIQSNYISIAPRKGWKVD